MNVSKMFIHTVSSQMLEQCSVHAWSWGRELRIFFFTNCTLFVKWKIKLYSFWYSLYVILFVLWPCNAWTLLKTILIDLLIILLLACGSFIIQHALLKMCSKALFNSSYFNNNSHHLGDQFNHNFLIT